MNIIKPMQQGIMTRTFVKDKRFYLSVASLSYFPFHNPVALGTEQEMWETITSSCSKDTTFDLCMPKARGEVMMMGKCFAPRKTPVPKLFVDLDFGPIIKRVIVFGDRYWKKGHSSDGAILRYIGHDWEISNPEPFLKMDIGWKNAFGGEGFDHNPWGKGYLPKDTGPRMDNLSPLPNVERPDRVILEPASISEPAGYGPMEALWPQRASKVGKKYDKRWEKERFPEPAEDMNPTYYNASHEDQQLKDGYWTGNEKFVITNMHPDHPEQRSSLPQIRPRCFVLQRDDQKERWTEIDLYPETVWLFPNVERGILISRGIFEVDTFYGIDVDTLLFAWELKEGKVRTCDDYRKSVQLREDEETSTDWTIREDDLSPPEGIPEEEDFLVDGDEDADGRPDPTIERDMEKANGLLGKAKEMLEKCGVNPSEYLSGITIEAPVFTSQPQFRKMSDVGKFHEWAKAEITKAEETASEFDSKSRFGIYETQAEAKKAIEDRARAACKEAGEDYDSLKAAAVAAPSGKSILERTSDLIQLARTEMVKHPDNAKELDSVFKKLDDGALQIADSDDDPDMKAMLRGTIHYMDPPVMPSTEKTAFLREWVVKKHKAGEGLADEDLSGVDLSELDLQGANFKGALLDSANLSNANLTGANLSEATLARANFTDCVLIGADLSKSGLGKTLFKRADLTNADITEASIHLTDFANAVLKATVMKTELIQESNYSYANLEGVIISETNFIKTKFDGANLQRAMLEKTSFMECSLLDVDFTRSNLEEASFVQTNASGSNFTSAYMKNANAHLNSKFANCVAMRIEGEALNFSETDLSGANFSEARILNAAFGESCLKNAIFDRAIARNADFTDSDLSDARFEGTDLMKSSLQGTRLLRTRFCNAHLFGADLLNAQIEDAVFYGAVIKRTLLEDC